MKTSDFCSVYEFMCPFGHRCNLCDIGLRISLAPFVDAYNKANASSMGGEVFAASLLEYEREELNKKLFGRRQ